MKAVNYSAGVLFILCSVWGMIASIWNENAINKLVGLALFTSSLTIGIFIILKGWRSMFNITLLLFLLQIATFKCGTVKFVFASIASIVVYLPVHSSGSKFFSFSTPYANLVGDNYYDGVSVGINLFAILILCIILLMGKEPTTTFK